jgi:GH24 family phage-related lysozyme (muramidase)
VDWLRIAIECESCSLNDLSKELYSCRYAGSDKSQHAVAAVLKRLRRGVPAAVLVAALAAAGFTGAIWSDVVNTLKEKIDNREAIRIDEIVSKIDGSLKDSLQEERIPYREMEVPVGAPVAETVRPPTSTGAIAAYVGANEGSRNRVYLDSYEHPTIGVGHLLTPDCRQLFRSLFGDSVDFDGIMNGTSELTDEQVQTLFEHDLGSRLDTARRMFPRFNDFHQNVQNAIVDGIYRGDLGGSPNARRLMNMRRWEEAAREYLNHREYQTARAALDRGQRPRNAGIVRRMEENARMFREFGN